MPNRPVPRPMPLVPTSASSSSAPACPASSARSSSQEAGLDDFAIYEKADRLGGTWRENTYPGIACDVPSHFYSYSFALNPEWSHRFAPGAEIQAYFEDVARRYGVGLADSVSARRSPAARSRTGAGRSTLTDGSTDEADVVIAATGVLHHPAYPDIEGLDSFAGAVLPQRALGSRRAARGQARRRHRHRLDGGPDRLGAGRPGAGAVALPAHPAVDRARREPAVHRGGEGGVPRSTPRRCEAIRAKVSRSRSPTGFANVLVDADVAAAPGRSTTVCLANLENSVTDPVLREKLRPNYRAACKRLILSTDFYDAIQRPNARLVTERIERIETGRRAHPRRTPARARRAGAGDRLPRRSLHAADAGRRPRRRRPSTTCGRTDRPPTWRSRSPTSRISSC